MKLRYRKDSISNRYSIYIAFIMDASWSTTAEFNRIRAPLVGWSVYHTAVHTIHQLLGSVIGRSLLSLFCLSLRPI